MIQHVIRERDFLFFYQILLPLCDTSLSGIWDDKRIPYYSEVDKLSNIYAYQIGLGGSYGHGFKPVKLPEIVCHDWFIIRDSLWCVTSGTIYLR